MKLLRFDDVRTFWGSLTSSRRELCVAIVFVIFFAVGTAGHYITWARSIMLFLTPAVLLVYGGIALTPVVTEKNDFVLIWFILTYGITFALEAVGVETGVIFGEYTYGATLGLQLFSVPVIIGFNWVIVVFGAALFVRRIRDRIVSALALRRQSAVSIVSGILAPVCVGAFALLFDLVLEPVAIRFDYWAWAGIEVPGRNYLAWFVIATVVSIPVTSMKNPTRSKLPIYYVLVQFLFMASLLPLSL